MWEVVLEPGEGPGWRGRWGGGGQKQGESKQKSWSHALESTVQERRWKKGRGCYSFHRRRLPNPTDSYYHSSCKWGHWGSGKLRISNHMTSLESEGLRLFHLSSCSRKSPNWQGQDRKRFFLLLPPATRSVSFLSKEQSVCIPSSLQ